MIDGLCFFDESELSRDLARPGRGGRELVALHQDCALFPIHMHDAGGAGAALEADAAARQSPLGP